MCGRAVEISTIEVIAAEFGIDNPRMTIKPNYNVSPSQDVITVIKQGSRQLVNCRWGFVPSWAKDLALGYKMINARAETIATKPAYRSAYRKQRCLIVADGFYEWKKTEKGKTPYYIHLRSGKPFGLAGIYNRWVADNGEGILTCSVITTTANEIIEPVHDRMPVIIPKDGIDAWLSDEANPSSMLRPYPSDDMKLYQITTKVNDPHHNSPELLEPVLK